MARAMMEAALEGLVEAVQSDDLPVETVSTEQTDAGVAFEADSFSVYAIIGDGETDEGQIWEAALYAGHAKLDNLIAFTDYNKCQLDGYTDKINGLDPLDNGV